MELLRSLLISLLLLLCFTSSIVVLSQDPQAGFITLNCGGENFTDETTDLRYTSDWSFIGDNNNAVRNTVSSQYFKDRGVESVDTQWTSVTSFPKGIRNCYTLRPAQGKLNKYLIRARFVYGNYDGNADKQLPQFDLHLGVQSWDTVVFDPKDDPSIVDKEIIHTPSSDLIHVCLVNTGLGTPFISVLELRPLKISMYPDVSAGWSMMMKKQRFDIGSTSPLLRYKDDVFDRIWYPLTVDNRSTLINTPSTDNLDTNDGFFNVPPGVMRTAIVPSDPTQPWSLSWSTDNSSDMFYMCMTFAEIQQLKPNQTREFNVYLNGDLFLSTPIVPHYMSTITLYTKVSLTNRTDYIFSLNKTKKSTLPPIINALEIYHLKQFNEPQTDDNDVAAMFDIKSDYGVTNKNWQGDPCSPVSDSWNGLKCHYTPSNPPRIISMNLSSSGLTGPISSYIFNLTMIQVLDLSNNNLSGPIPDFLSQLPSLSILKLSGNNFSGPVPEKLLEKSKEGNLALSIEGVNSCQNNGSCDHNKKKKNIVVSALASVASVLLLGLAIVGILLVVKRRKQREPRLGVASEARVVDVESKINDGLQSKNRRYNFAEIIEITKNFKRVLGKGGFGTVYHGRIDGTQVAVKMLSSTSGQGFKEFQSEANVLMNVHHKNLTSLVGYCIDGTNIGIIYEFMANGNLHQHLSAGNHNVLSFRDRLQIAADSAQGLEYLHHGCKPPVVHRDVKCTNILLNEKFQAKIADFGLSRAYPDENQTHISTVIAGTWGYVDPEYYTLNKLTEKSDVYSFGVVILEIMTGQPAIIGKAPDQAHISRWVTSMLKNGNIKDAVDPRLMGEFDANSAWKTVELALACVSQDSDKRPTMNEVVSELKDCLATEMARHGGTTSQRSIDNLPAATIDSEFGPMAR
ncbi:PREDICTED: putative leucine-rich repeat receptor-like protein kinase At2g19210 isoform X2 [Ipomoea nil]|uniref:putative leucine-rich repeat receptor-like protein kinase At2g19210 isoform X2 n=1 Tax=Ipomoea nil TaxID=35883 RepID=UPI0009010300|nr:PREDICTED: putative leucine-rich repeat receptor-like protein kinase At2g19210 isoform X2 [Ipomoea nil]